MARVRNDGWKDDLILKESLQKYVKDSLSREEILDFVTRDFYQYSWSMRTLDRRLRHFQIYYHDTSVSIDQVQEAVRVELQGPGKLLGYRAMQQKIRQCHDLFVPRDLVYVATFDQDPIGLQRRTPMFKEKKGKGNFTTLGPNWVHSLDGHDKLMGYQNSTFPIAVYACLDTCSRKVLWAKIWNSNSDPKLIGRFYFDYIYENKIIASRLRLDKGTETGVMATMHAYLRQGHGDMNAEDSIIFGQSTSNQIERWWKELHERLEKYYKQPLNQLKDQCHYDPHNAIHRSLLSYIMVPLMQKEIDTFVRIWNSHRIRAQKNTVLPDGTPNHIYNFPQNYGLQECGWKVEETQLREVAELSEVLTVGEDYLDPGFRQNCAQILPDPHNLAPSECTDAFIFLKESLA